MKVWNDYSDSEINQMVTIEVFGLQGWDFSECKEYFFCCDISGQETYTQEVLPYCDNWSAIGPMIDYHKISLLSDEDNWEAEITYMANVGAYQTSEECSHFYTDKNPKRSAAIVYLISKGVKP